MSRDSGKRLLLVSVAVILGLGGCGGDDAGVSGGGGYAPAPQVGGQQVEEAEPEARTAVPDVLVGEWDGDKFDYIITSDGFVSITRLGQGTVEVAGGSITFHVPGGPWTSSWQVTPCGDPAGYGFAYRTLLLDGISYVQDC